jgi:hypothetical protein
LKEGTPEYQEKLAVGLHWFVTFPRKDQPVSEGSLLQLRERIRVDGLDGFFKYLIENGGIRVRSEKLNELSALLALEHNRGECTEDVKILFAVLKMAKLVPIFPEFRE